MTVSAEKRTQSHELFQQACQHLVGGVNSPVRAFKSVGSFPCFIKSAKGSMIYDVDDHSYTDFVASWGPMILGHNHPAVETAIAQQLKLGTSYGAPHAKEVELARLVKARMPSIEQLRMTSSGTEATMSAVRLARGFTGRHKIIKFAGCYHGHADLFLVEAGSGALTLGHPSSPGVPAGSSQDTLIARFNNLDDVKALFDHYSTDIAAVIVEPIAANMNVIMPNDDFLPGLRELCTQRGALLIFDEIITGFRVHPGGAQALYQVTPDLSTLGKILGGGLPAAAFGGRKDVMAQLAPEGPVYQAGTLSGNPLATSAGCATLNQLNDSAYQQLESTAHHFAETMNNAAAKYNFPLHIVRQGSLIGLRLSNDHLENHHDLCHINTETYAAFFQHMLERGHYFAPSAFEACFVSTAHNCTQIDRCAADAQAFFKEHS